MKLTFFTFSFFTHVLLKLNLSMPSAWRLKVGHPEKIDMTFASFSTQMNFKFYSGNPAVKAELEYSLSPFYTSQVYAPGLISLSTCTSPYSKISPA
jgi:hypothetical protein